MGIFIIFPQLLIYWIEWIVCIVYRIYYNYSNGTYVYCGEANDKNKDACAGKCYA